MAIDLWCRSASLWRRRVEILSSILNSPILLEIAVSGNIDLIKHIPNSLKTQYMCEIVFEFCHPEERLGFYNLFPENYRTWDMIRCLNGLPLYPYDDTTEYDWDDDSVAETVYAFELYDTPDTPDSW